jgi:3,4-dihydroxy 2-butanone 4-phosphate synthase/GTP cyclohydrolase II
MIHTLPLEGEGITTINMIIKLTEGPLETKFGIFTEQLYYDGQKESVALIMGNISGEENVLCRIHSSCLSAHVFNSVECDCREQFEMAQRLIQREGRGIIVWLDQEGRSNGHLALLASAHMRSRGISQSESYIQLGYVVDGRSYKTAAAILKNLNVRSITLLTNNPDIRNHDSKNTKTHIKTRQE